MLRRTHVSPYLRVSDPDRVSGRRAGPDMAPDMSVPMARLDIDFLPPGPEGGPLLPFLDRLCRIVRRLEGAPRGRVTELLRRQERRVRDARRLSGISKTLLDACQFRRAEGHDDASRLREAVHLARGAAWPPVPGDEDRPWEVVARAEGLEVDALRERVLADRPDRAVLVRAPKWDGAVLLDRYNLGLVQAALLDAESLVFRARGGWKGVFRAMRRVRLMSTVEREGRRTYRMELTGPAAPFVTRSQRYGIRMARILPELLRAPGARLEARVLHEGRPALLRLDADHAVFGFLAGQEREGKGTRKRHDSKWEEDLAKGLRDRIEAHRGGERDGWTLVREDAPVVLPGGAVFLPDFTLRHRDGREAWVELVGFWTPEYLATKLAKVREARAGQLVLVVPRRSGATGPEVAAALEALGDSVAWFTTSPRPGAVLEVAERVARVPGGGGA